MPLTNGLAYFSGASVTKKRKSFRGNFLIEAIINTERRLKHFPAQTHSSQSSDLTGILFCVKFNQFALHENFLHTSYNFLKGKVTKDVYLTMTLKARS